VPAPFARLRGRPRQQLIVKGLDSAAVAHISRHLAEAGRSAPRGVQVAVDVDPVNML
jgi:primosomal protein N'